MSDHDALLAAIVDQPDEDTPRLMFADWLDEHADALPTPAAGRARAAFIRGDIAMSQLDEYDPVRLRWELIEKPAREAEPWAAGALPSLPTWLMFDRPPLIRIPLFRRGFPWALAAPDADAPPAAVPADVAAPVERLRLVRCRPTTVAAVRAAPWRGRLRELAFENRGPVEPLSALANFTPAPIDRLSFVGESLAAGEVRALIASPLFDRLAALSVVRGGGGTPVAEALVREGARSALRAPRVEPRRLSAPARRAPRAAHVARGRAPARARPRRRPDRLRDEIRRDCRPRGPEPDGARPE